MSIEVTNLSKFYGKQKVLNGLSFTINKGEIVGFLGPNGAGKSTTMKVLTGSLAPAEGSITVNGYDVSTQKKRIQQSIGYLPENNPLYPDMYVREFLNFNAEMYKTDKQAVKDIIELTGLTSEAHKKIRQLSKGYRQRVGLAAALLHSPEVLILDEPTTGLDPNQLLQIRQLIKTIGREKTVLLSTHILQEVEAICDRVLIIHKGELVADKKMSALRDAASQCIEVEFDYRVEEAFLQEIPHLKTITNTVGFVYELSFTTSKDMRSAVFDFAHDNGLKILQLHPRHKNLELLFRELTAS